MNLLVVEIMFVLCLTSGGVMAENHFVCKQINEIFSPVTSVPSNVRHAQGRPGKKGNKGEVGGIGPKGSKGEVGEVNYDVINVTMRDIADKLEKIQEEQGREISSLKNSLSRVVERLCAIFYNGKCFVPVPNKKATLDQAREICMSMGGDVANIYDSTHFNLIMNHVRSNVLNGSSEQNFRIGLTYNPTTSQVLLTNGSKAPYLRWFPGYPESHRKYSSFTTIILQVDNDASSSYQNLFTRPPSHAFYLLCEI